MNELDSYKHLDKDDPVIIKLDMEALAGLVDGMNYGGHRFLSAWVKVRLLRRPGNPLAGAIKDLLAKGLY